MIIYVVHDDLISGFGGHVAIPVVGRYRAHLPTLSSSSVLYVIVSEMALEHFLRFAVVENRCSIDDIYHTLPYTSTSCLVAILLFPAVGHHRNNCLRTHQGRFSKACSWKTMHISFFLIKRLGVFFTTKRKKNCVEIKAQAQMRVDYGTSKNVRTFSV